MVHTRRHLKTAIGRTAFTEPLFTGAVVSRWLHLELEPFATINRAFAPMVRKLAFEVSELAIATFLQAREADIPIVLLPVVLAARFQEAALLCLKSSDLRGPGDLRGKRIGVRSYSQTTGMWLRGVLEDQFGVQPRDVAWTTFEAAHVRDRADPPWAERAPAGSDLMAMLRAGQLDAVIVGNDAPDADDLRPVFGDPKAAGKAFYASNGFIPVNHLLTIRRDIAVQTREVADELIRLFSTLETPQSTMHPIGRAAIDPAISVAVRHCVSQGLISRPLSLDQVWAI